MPFYNPKKKYQPARQIQAVPFEHCAAKTTPDDKPGTTVFEHCRNVGCVANELVKLLPESLQEAFSSNPALLASMHDVGKVSPGYELKYFRDTIIRKYAPALAEDMSFSTHHAAVSAAAIEGFLKPISRNPRISPVVVAAASHHGSADRSYPPDTSPCLGGQSWADERRKLIEKLIEYFGGFPQEAECAYPALLSGLTSVADWVGSDEEFFPSDKPPAKKDDPAETARYAVNACGFPSVRMRRGLSFKDIFSFDPHKAQQQFIEKIEGPGTYVLEAPMGVGKTEAALYAAYRLMEKGHHHGFYFALPTRLTSDKIYERVIDFLQKISDVPTAPILAHGAAWLNAYAQGGEDMSSGKPWFNPMKRALLYPYAVGTIDQALKGVLRVKHGFVRLFGLAGKIVILDEVHSYDIYTGMLLDELVGRLEQIGCTVIILSATLTAKRRFQLVSGLDGSTDSEDYPLMTVKPTGGDPFCTALASSAGIECRVRLEAWDDRSVARSAVAGAREGKCVVCIANTVARAQDWYKAVKAEATEEEFDVGILHSRFPMVWRRDIEDHWIKTLGKNANNRRAGCVLISTQILEQSVDIDADWMLSELAPSDMLLQRMGRMWRHSRKNRPCAGPELVVLTQDPSSCATPEDVTQALGKGNCCVYDPYVLMRTYVVWHNRKTVSIPSDIRAIIEETYEEITHSKDDLMGRLKEHLQRKSERLRRLARSAQDDIQGMPTGSDDERAATRYSDLPTRTVLLLAGVEEISGRNDQARVRLLDGAELDLSMFKPDFEATKLLHGYTVSIASHLLPDRGNINQDRDWLKRHFFDRPIVLLMEENGRLTCFQGPETDLFCSPEYGVWRNIEGKSVAGSKYAANSEDEMLEPLVITDW